MPKSKSKPQPNPTQGQKNTLLLCGVNQETIDLLDFQQARAMLRYFDGLGAVKASSEAKARRVKQSLKWWNSKVFRDYEVVKARFRPLPSTVLSSTVKEGCP